MKNIAFTIWMIGWPLSQIISSYVYEYKIGREYTANGRALGTALELIIWVYIAVKLYESNAN